VEQAITEEINLLTLERQQAEHMQQQSTAAAANEADSS
jgi:hypothetical protein